MYRKVRFKTIAEQIIILYRYTTNTRKINKLNRKQATMGLNAELTAILRGNRNTIRSFFYKMYKYFYKIYMYIIIIIFITFLLSILHLF